MDNKLHNITTSLVKDHQQLNKSLIDGFHANKDNTEVKRSHLFEGRYENIYLNETHIPELTQLINEAIAQAETILQTKNLQAACWFNHMPPDAVTLPHSHDDYDERLSAVYYVYTPKNSGDLIIHDKGGNVRIHPEAGMLVFFPPDIVHEVTQNKSHEERLSIGINFGTRKHEA